MPIDALGSTLGNQGRDVRSRDPYQTYSPFAPEGKESGAGTVFDNLYRLDPRQLSPVQRFPSGSPQLEVEDFFNQLRPTSENVRNRGVMNILQNMNMPMEQLYASQLSEPLAEGRRSSLDQLRSQMTQRGLYGSGVADEARLGVEMDYLKGVKNVAQQARSKEIERQAGLAAQLQGVAQNDIDYYRYLVAGRNAVFGMTQPSDIAAISNLSKGASGIAAAALFGNNRTPEAPYYGETYDGRSDMPLTGSGGGPQYTDEYGSGFSGGSF